MKGFSLIGPRFSLTDVKYAKGFVDGTLCHTKGEMIEPIHKLSFLGDRQEVNMYDMAELPNGKYIAANSQFVASFKVLRGNVCKPIVIKEVE